MYLPATPEIERAARFKRHDRKEPYTYLAHCDERELRTWYRDTIMRQKDWRRSFDAAHSATSFMALMDAGRKIAAIRRVARLRGWDLG